MRLLTRSAVIGILILSCAVEITDPTENCFQPDTDVALFPDSLHLAVGSADQAWLQWGCFVTPPTAEIKWIIRDPTIASDGDDTRGPSSPPRFSPNDPARTIQPRAPGRTFLVVEAGGHVDSLAVSVPDTVVMGSVTHIAAGGDVSCAVSDGDIALCWGTGSGVLGEPWVDPAIGTCWGTSCSPMPVPRKTDARSVAVSNIHACSLDAFGNAWCWGDGSALGMPGSRFYDPVAVSGGITFTTLTLGRSHTCGLTSVGAAYCWGDDSIGQLGSHQTSGPVAAPKLVAGDLQWVSLDTNEGRTCGVTDAGHLYCWGNLGNFNSTLANTTCQTGGEYKGGDPIQVPCAYVPRRMPLATFGLTADSLFVQVSGRCARTSLGSVFCDSARSAYTRMVGFGPFAVISGGGSHTCGLTAGGAAWCWGSNSLGGLGDGTTESRRAPVAVTGGHTFTQVTVGGEHTCGLTADQEVWCWGANHVGQAGTSILSQPWAPVKVHGQG